MVADDTRRQPSVHSTASSAGVGRSRDNYCSDDGYRMQGRPPRVVLAPAAETPAKRPAADLSPATVSKARGFPRESSVFFRANRVADPIYDPTYHPALIHI